LVEEAGAKPGAATAATAAALVGTVAAAATAAEEEGTEVAGAAAKMDTSRVGPLTLGDVFDAVSRAAKLLPRSADTLYVEYEWQGLTYDARHVMCFIELNKYSSTLWRMTWQASC